VRLSVRVYLYIRTRLECAIESPSTVVRMVFAMVAVVVGVDLTFFTEHPWLD
jgi:hypothetical protein